MSNSVPLSNQSESLSLLELHKGDLSPAETLRILGQLVTEIRHLHDSGRLHRAISIEVVSVCRATLEVSIGTFPEQTVSFGGPGCEFETCPPELQRSLLLQVPADLTDARGLMNEAGLSFDPVRIDIYQLGALLCRLLTGKSVESFLQSPKTKNSIPVDLLRLIERALGYHAKECYTELKDLERDISELKQNYPILASDFANDSLSDAAHNRPQKKSGDTAPSIVSDNLEPETATVPNNPSPSSSGDALPFNRLGHYEIVGRIGYGGMGDVYKGYEKDLDRTVAIKVLPVDFARQDEFVIRFYAEATAAAKLIHPNIIQIHFIGEDHGHHFFVMQYVEGESLADLLKRHKQLSVDQTLAIVQQTLSGLSLAHEQGMIHRDVKPGNILLDRKTRRALLADFGLVKTVEGVSGLTATGVVVGTVDYISPEQGRGQTVDGRSDLYSIGVLLYQMLSGRLPFEAESPTAMIFQHVYEHPPSLEQVGPDVPSALAAVVEKLMAKSPVERYQTAEEVLADLRAFRAGEPLPSGADAKQTHSEVVVAGADFQSSTIIQAPDFDELTLLPPELESSVASAWWSRTRQRLLDLFQIHAPEFLRQLQNTQQQVDGAVAEYERRCNRLQQLAGEAEEVITLLQTQIKKYRELAAEAQARADHAESSGSVDALVNEKNKYEQTADELEKQSNQQQEQRDDIRLRLSQANATLVKLRTQRDLLTARLRTAQAKAQLAGVRITTKRRWIPIAIAVSVLVGCFFLGNLALNAILNSSSSVKSETEFASQPTTERTVVGSTSKGNIDANRLSQHGESSQVIAAAPTKYDEKNTPNKKPSTANASSALVGGKVEVKLSEPFSQIRTGGAGRLLIMHQSRAHKLIIVDVVLAQIVHEIPLPADDVLFAAGRDKLLVILLGQNLIQRWSLNSFEREKTVRLPDDRPVIKVQMGCSSQGPLYLWWGSNVTLFDIETMQPMEVDGKSVNGDRGYDFCMRVSADGRFLTSWHAGIAPAGFSLLRFEKPTTTLIPSRDAFSHNWRFFQPSADGYLILSDGGGVYSRDLKRFATTALKGSNLLHTEDPRFFLSLRSQDKSHSQVSICTVCDLRTVFTVKDLENVTSSSVLQKWGRVMDQIQRGEPRVRFLPSADRLVMLPSNDRIVVRHFNLIEELEKTGESYLFATSVPRTDAAAGRTYSHVLEVESKTGGVKFTLQAAPDGMTISEAGELRWNVSPRHAGKVENVIVTVHDASGSEFFYAFALAVKP